MKIVTNRKFLTQKCEDVQKNEVAHIKAQLAVYMRKYINKGYGVASNQIGKQKRAFVMHLGRGKFMFFINPIIHKKIGTPFLHEEGCLSLPNSGTFKVMRYPKVEVWDDHNGRQVFNGLQASICQHEIDHLDGILIDQKEE